MLTLPIYQRVLPLCSIYTLKHVVPGFGGKRARYTIRMMKHVVPGFGGKRARYTIRMMKHVVSGFGRKEGKVHN